MKDLRILVPDIRSVHNIGSIFRTGDAVGVSRIYLSGTSPTPLDKYGVPRSDMAKVALGAEKHIPWEYVDAKETIQKLKEEGFQILGLEQTENSVLYTEIQAREKCVLVVGNEVEGMSKELIALMDTCIYIPMVGKKESLNVSVAFGIAVYRLMGR